MKKLMNFTTSIYDTERYIDNADLKAFYSGFNLDGLELMFSKGGRDDIVAQEDVIGVHLRYFTSWMDLWVGNERRLLDEFGDFSAVEKHFGGTEASALTEAFIDNVKCAAEMSPDYLVFHVSENRLDETALRSYHYRSDDVIDAAAKLVNSFADSIPSTALLLYENLWHSGLTMLEPELTLRLIEKTQHPNVGVMLDIGHLLITDMSLRTIDEGVDYIHRVLDRYDDLSFIRGVHLHQSLSGEYSEHLMRSWMTEKSSFSERNSAFMQHIFRIDTHAPFASARISELLARILPDYLVLEFLSSKRLEHAEKLKEQLKYLSN